MQESRKNIPIQKDTLWAMVHSSTLDGDIVKLDRHALDAFLLAVRDSEYRQPELTVYSDGLIECSGKPVVVSGKPADVIRAIHSHGAITRTQLSIEVWGDSYQSSTNISTTLERARKALRQHGMTISSLPNDKVSISREIS